jgi:hypothetical protein
MADALDDFLAEYGVLPWAWGRVDCSLALAAWAARCGHDEGAAPFVGRYASREECERIVRGGGGLLAIVSARAEALRLAPVDRPTRGAIGVIGSRRNELRQWGAIHDGARWMVRTMEGFAPAIGSTLGMWDVPCRKPF